MKHAQIYTKRMEVFNPKNNKISVEGFPQVYFDKKIMEAKYPKGINVFKMIKDSPLMKSIDQFL
jgi:hypothetical protein